MPTRSIYLPLIHVIGPNEPTDKFTGMRWLETVSLTDLRAKYPLAGYWEWDGADWRGEKHYTETVSFDNAASGTGVYFPTPPEADRLEWSIRLTNYSWYVQMANNATNYYQMRIVSRNASNTETIISEVTSISQGNLVTTWINAWNRTLIDFSIDTTSRKTLRGSILTAAGLPGSLFGAWTICYNYLRP